MILFDGTWYFPDGETHLPGWMTQMQQRRSGRLGYQLNKYEAALAYCPPDRRRVAVDVGAHVGLFSYWMAEDFGALHAFEPIRAHRECWMINMLGRRGAATLYPYALGNQHGIVSLVTGPSSSGDTSVALDAPTHGEQAPVLPLDTLALPAVDFIKIDCEGFERYVLEGAVETIRACRPVILVEQKPGHGLKYGISDTAGVEFLATLGYRERETLNGDVILTSAEPA